MLANECRTSPTQKSLLIFPIPINEHIFFIHPPTLILYNFSIAAVSLETTTAYLGPTYLAIYCSNFSTTDDFCQIATSKRIINIISSIRDHSLFNSQTKE